MDSRSHVTVVSQYQEKLVHTQIQLFRDRLSKRSIKAYIFCQGRLLKFIDYIPDYLLASSRALLRFFWTNLVIFLHF